MIKSSELRIGNKVIVHTYEYTGGRPIGAIITKGIEVFAIIKHPISAQDKRPVIMFKDDDRMNEHFLNENVIPIPLTPEWLERCGFAIETIPDSVDEEGDIIKGYTHWTNGKFCFHFSDGKVEGREHIQYVHLFQNWYYFNTGEELTIKE